VPSSLIIYLKTLSKNLRDQLISEDKHNKLIEAIHSG